jgi:hypothetical protein
MLISTENKNKNFYSEKNSNQNSNSQNSKMNYSPCFTDPQRIKAEEITKINFEKIRNSINLLSYFEEEFFLDDSWAIQKILKIKNLPANFCLDNGKSNSNSSVFKESLLLQNFCDSITHKDLKEILNKILDEYKSLIRVPDTLISENPEISEEEKKTNLEKLVFKQLQEERIKNLFSQLADIFNNFEFRRDNNLEKNLNDAYIVLETLMYIFSSYFIYFREKFDFDFTALTKQNLYESVKCSSFSTEKTKSEIEIENNFFNQSNLLDKAKSQINNSCFTKENISYKGLGIFDGIKKNENPERKKPENLHENEKSKLKNQLLNKEEAESKDFTKLFSEEKANEVKFDFISLMLNLFEEENFINLFNCLVFTLDKLKNKTFNGFYSAINLKYLNTLFTSGKKSIKHFDNLITFSVFTKQILSEENFFLFSKLLKINNSQVNRFQIQSEYLDRIVFEYFLLNFKDENKTFLDKFSNLNCGLNSQLLFFSAFLSFWNKEKFYNVYNNIDFNTVFSSCNEALNQLINNFRPKLIALLEELLAFFADPQKFMFKHTAGFYKHLDTISLDIFTNFLDNLRQFICNHIYAAYVNDNNFELINRIIWIKTIIEIFSLSNFLLKLLQINEILKCEKDNLKNNCLNQNYKGPGGLQINEDLVYKLISHVFVENFKKICTAIPKRMLYIREIYMLNFLFLFVNFLEKAPFYLKYFNSNPEKQIISALEKFAKFQNKYFFMLANYLLKLIFPDKKHKLRIYSFHNFPLDYSEIEESGSLKSKISEIIYGRADTNQLLISESIKGPSEAKNTSKDNDYTNPNNGLFAEKNNFAFNNSNNLNLQNFILDNGNINHAKNNCPLIYRFESQSANIHLSELLPKLANNYPFSLDKQYNPNFHQKHTVEEFIEEDAEIDQKRFDQNNPKYFIFPGKSNIFNPVVDKSNMFFENDANLIDSNPNNFNKPLKNEINYNLNTPTSQILINEVKNIKEKSRNNKPKSLSKAQIKKRLSFQSETFYDFSALFLNFQFEHLKVLEKINNKKLKFSYLNYKNNKISNLNANNSQSFENSISSGEKVFLKVTKTKASLVLVQKEDEILFFDDSNFSDIKTFFAIDMINKADLEYFLLISEDNLKDNNHMQQNFLNNFENCDLKNELSFEAVIENMYFFLD